VVRRVPLLVEAGGTEFPRLAMEALRVAQGGSTFLVKLSNPCGETAFGEKTGVVVLKNGDVTIPTDPRGEIRVYYAKSDARRSIPAWKNSRPRGQACPTSRARLSSSAPAQQRIFSKYTHIIVVIDGVCAQPPASPTSASAWLDWLRQAAVRARANIFSGREAEART
jgi:hypothetical protein